ncbi:MAG TPA: hypothetical protein VKD88_07770, partial [Gaiellaceae bacterium]|nr:hypothetical protein [Gaiellaceae bacterium]
MNSVVEKPVATVTENDGTHDGGGAEMFVHGIFRFAMDRRERRDIRLIAQTSEELERLLRGGRQALQPSDHQVDEILGEAFGFDPLDVPRPGSRARIEFQKAFLFEAGEKLAREEWVAVGLASDELSERLHLPRCAAKGVAQEVSDVTDRERTENDLID